MNNTNILEWTTTNEISVGKHLIPCAYDLKSMSNQKAGICRESRLKLALKTISWPIRKLRDDLLIDGFIERRIGKWIKECIKDDSVFLEIGCGDMSLRRFLSKDICYNAFDISLSAFHLKRVLRKRESINVALASATKIPLDPSTVHLAVCTEVLEHIEDIDKVLSEIHRILKPGGILITSIPNNYCYKYQKKGPHPKHINYWTFGEFKEYLIQKDFTYLEGFMKGLWIPLTIWPGKASYQLPISSKNEFYNTNFLYMFKVDK